jgi:hypothetical protein
MQWKDIATKLDTLIDELTDVVPGKEAQCNTSRVDPEKAADKWVRQYVRSRQLPLPCSDVLRILFARATYAATFAKLAPRQELELPTGKAAEIVEILMIELWHECFRDKWRKRIGTEELAFAA